MTELITAGRLVKGHIMETRDGRELHIKKATLVKEYGENRAEVIYEENGELQHTSWAANMIVKVK